MSYYYNYSDQNIPFDIENIVKPGMLKLINKLNLHYKVLYQNYKAYSVEIKYKNIYIEYKAIDFSKHATDRGGFLKDGIKIIDKTSQCFLPNFHVAVDYDGNYTLCCNIRSDIEEHKNYILGNIKNNSIFDIFMGEKIIQFRKDLLIDGKKKGACSTCSDPRTWDNFF